MNLLPVPAARHCMSKVNMYPMLLRSKLHVDWSEHIEIYYTWGTHSPTGRGMKAVWRIHIASALCKACAVTFFRIVYELTESVLSIWRHLNVKYLTGSRRLHSTHSTL